MKKILYILSIIILLGAGVLYVLTGQETNKVPANDQLLEQGVWAEYRNARQGYSLRYPNELSAYPQNESQSVLSFSASDQDPWLISVRVDDAESTTPEGWVREQNEQYKTNFSIEKDVLIDGNEAVVVFVKNETESYPDEKTAIVIKKGKVFQLSTRSVDHEKVWDEFRFVPK